MYPVHDMCLHTLVNVAETTDNYPINDCILSLIMMHVHIVKLSFLFYFYTQNKNDHPADSYSSGAPANGGIPKFIQERIDERQRKVQYIQIILLPISQQTILWFLILRTHCLQSIG